MSNSPVTADFIYDLPAVSEPAASPDGSTTVYVRSTISRNDFKRTSVLELIPFWGGNAQQFTSGPDDGHPLWSPDGSTVGFLRRGTADEPRQLWLIPRSGGEARCVTKALNGVLDFAWGPDGDTVWFISEMETGRRSRKRDAETDVPKVREVNRLYYRGDTLGWRGDAYRQLFRLDVGSGVATQMTRGDYDHDTPTPSPDGSMVAFQSTRSRNRHRKFPWGGELCVMASDGGRVTRLTPGSWHIGGIVWDAHSMNIAYVAAGESERWQYYIHIFNRDKGTDLRVTDDSITPQAGFHPTSPPPPLAWVDDKVLFLADSKGSSGLYSVDMLGSIEELRVETETISSISYSSSADRVALVSSTESRPGEVVALELSNGHVERATHATDEYMAGHATGTTRKIVTHRNEFDIDSWLVQPPDFDAGKRYPLILDVHGGPNGAFTTGFNVLHQILAGAGYLVLAVNPRGSSSYGSDFTARVFRDWGGEDYLDLLATLDVVCELTYVDRDRIGIHGYSYGGYMTTWAVGHTDRFKAAVAGAPCTNLFSMYGQTDIGVSFGEIQWGGRPHEEPQWYLDHSPIMHVEKVDTPVLLLHGEADIRVPISQSEEYYVALKRSGKTVDFVRFPGCSHLFLRSGHPEMRREYYGRVVGWFDQWMEPS